MKKRPILYLIIGICVLIIPTLIYLCILVPKMSDEYNILMASGGVIGGAGFYGASRIPDKIKFSSMFKLAANSFTVLTISVLVEKFIFKIIGLVAVFVVSFIIFTIMRELYHNARRKKENTELAEEIARGIAKTSE